MDERIPNECESCGRFDDRPKHHVYDGVRTTTKHLTCCAEDGCDLCPPTRQE